MADQGKLSETTTSFQIRIWNEDLAAFDRLQKKLRIPTDQLGRLLWHVAIWKSPEMVAEVMRLALGPNPDDEDSGAQPSPPSPPPIVPPLPSEEEDEN
jgi:hypothetical protein